VLTFVYSAWRYWAEHAQTAQWLGATIQSIATVFAIVVGGIWAFSAFRRKREHVPHLKVENRVSHWRVGDSTVVRLTVHMENNGGVIARISHAMAWVQQVRPVPVDIAEMIVSGKDPVPAGSNEIDWPLPVESRECDWSQSPCEIEPDEVDDLQFDFVVPPHIEAVQVYSHLQNDAKDKHIGWNTTTPYCDLTGASDGRIEDRLSNEPGKAESAPATTTG
jgi:hypothetical protein